MCRLAEKIRLARVAKERQLQLQEKAQLAAQEAQYERTFDQVGLRAASRRDDFDRVLVGTRRVWVSICAASMLVEECECMWDQVGAGAWVAWYRLLNVSQAAGLLLMHGFWPAEL